MSGKEATVFARRTDVTPKSVMRRLLTPLAVMVILMTAGAGGLLYQQHLRIKAF